MKVGLNLAYKNLNYGTLLQAFATQKVIDGLGMKTEILDYEGKNFAPSPEAIAYFGIQKIKKRILRKRMKKKPEDEIHRVNKEQRAAVAMRFRNEYLHDIVHFNNMKAMRDYAGSLSAVVVGSDQLWGPAISFTCFRTLMYVPENVKRVSYATSMGVDSYPWYVKRAAKKFLGRIDNLSVREEQAREIIKNVSGRDATVVLDPTYLLSEKEWKDIIPSESIIEGKYVLCYFLGDNDRAKRIAKEFADSIHLKVVAILSNEVTVTDDYADELITGRTPADFINLIRNAEYVFTDSFHGIAFSIIHNKQFFAFYRRILNTASKNSRIDHIVSLFSIENRLIKDGVTDVSRIEEIDYDKVNRILSERRESSLRFLKGALTEKTDG